MLECAYLRILKRPKVSDKAKRKGLRRDTSHDHTLGLNDK